MKNVENNEKGITLIALVVTIIVLLVLAGISISMLTGQNGILNRTQEAKSKTEKAQQDELDKIAEMEAMVQTAGTKVTNPSSYGENSNAQAIADGAGKYFALPDGAKYIEGTVDTGVVVEIKESEFVWVPVDDVVLDTSRDNELPKNEENETLNGKTYTPMAIQDGSDYKGLLYSCSGDNSYLRYGSNSSTKYQGTSEQFREPDVASYDTGDYKSEEIKLDTLKEEYNAMVESVQKYKGFYIARYELGLDKITMEPVFKNASIEKNNVMKTDASRSENNTWYGLYKKIETFSTKNDKIVSSMIWGSQYDAMINWMLKTERKIELDYNVSYNKTAITGSVATDVINNIYDLYGCHYEWTLENYNVGYRVRRGGYFENPLSPNSYNYDAPNSTLDYNSSRATLYIK